MQALDRFESEKGIEMGITFYPTLGEDDICDYATSDCALLPVSSWAALALRLQARKGLSTDCVIGSIPVPAIPSGIRHVAADCGGFVATFKWNGKYKYSPEQYIAWLDAVNPEWAAFMDYCCENEITTGKRGIIRERQQLTTGMAYRLWDDHKEKPWVWIPTIQGWDVADYARHALEMKPLIEEMKAFYEARGQGDLFRVGIGTLCARASAETIRQVVMKVAGLLPNIHLHLWGVKLSVFKSPIALPEQVVSVDSAAWDNMFYRGNEAWRSSGMTRRRYSFLIALPEYEAKIHAALTTPKQLHLFTD